MPYMLCLFVFVIFFFLTTFGRVHDPPSEEFRGERVKDRGAVQCRVAVCFSGHIRSLVYPVVHQSIRRNLIDTLKHHGCKADVFAHATLKDTVSRFKQVNGQHDMVPRWHLSLRGGMSGMSTPVVLCRCDEYFLWVWDVVVCSSFAGFTLERCLLDLVIDGPRSRRRPTGQGCGDPPNTQ